MKLLHEHYDVLDGGCGTFAVAQNPIVGDGSIRVLQVDDDVSILEISKLMLKDMNECFEIDSASSVDEAYKKLEFCNYDVVISDYEMPQKNGLEFLRELREQNNQIPFVLFTGRGREEVAITALNLGADAYINKQGNPETVYGELSHALNKAVERRVALKLLVESELKYRNVVQNTLVGIAILEGIPPRIVFANSAMGKIFGLSPEAIVALSSEEIVRRLYPDDRDHFTTSFERRIEGKEVESSLEFRGIRQDGSVIWLELCTTLIDYGGKKAVQAVFLDITERKKAEESLRQERDKLEALTANIGAGLVIISKDYKILWINDYLKQVTGASEGDPCFSSFNTCTSICPDCGPMKIFKGASIDRREYCNQT
ncbi:MAG TPA: response regulator, partial [Candidatus Nanoarchaeia archaeon]|nr:response regulator [Candidatus Nanoarchaeia archaeon]